MSMHASVPRQHLDAVLSTALEIELLGVALWADGGLSSSWPSHGAVPSAPVSPRSCPQFRGLS